MNSDKDDPNNHVPDVTPDDDWDGLDVEQDFNAQLPPRRADAPKMPRLDLNLSDIKSIEPARHASGAASSHEDSNLKYSGSIHINVNPERVISEKEDFLPALVMEDVKHGNFSALNMKRPNTPSRSKLGERDEWGEVQKKGSTRWMLYTALGMIILIVLTISVSYLNRDEPIRNFGNKELSRPARVNQNKESNADLGVLAQLANNDKEAIRIYGNYAQAKSPDDFTALIYLSELNAPSVTKSWKPIGAVDGWVPSDTSVWKTYQSGSLVFAELRGINHNFSKFVGVFRYDNKDLKMDWKATTGYGSASFTELKSGSGDGSEIRGLIEPSNFFTRPFPEEKYHSFIVRSPDEADSVWVYSEIGSDADKMLMQLFSVSPITGEQKNEAKVILSIEPGDRGSLPQQWLIKSLIAEDWLDQATP